MMVESMLKIIQDTIMGNSKKVLFFLNNFSQRTCVSTEYS